MSNNSLLYLECPCTSFPRSFARDYKETYCYPPFSTIYGFLLSLVGEEDLTAHLGVKLAMGIIGDKPPISRIVRKQRHHKFSKTHMGTYPPSQFSKPNFQELLTDLKVVVKLDSSEESAKIKLDERVAIALISPEQITRFGGISLGESWALINGIRPYREEDGKIDWFIKDCRGLISLPVWINRQNQRGTFQRFSLGEFNPNCWVEIQASRSS
ncbi:CRISPR-associated protein Cas5 [Stanieria cyanosphaera PCC 7437]|uniref:CRISPR-associated protein Cas5 n=1 Tax=Stanieria cyanosphaera (strain ATCC 29371 / PCC 7437) TaxID=111780 RepID=K9XUE8_STAC7|nr:CRISPR-associated protein Cas5 [Stanieria cyanosphaera]AFZ36225.1 CRISPR-associated protein Cas5 [Stanieria cyanosphaera PCC 7437]